MASTFKQSKWMSIKFNIYFSSLFVAMLSPLLVLTYIRSY